MHATGGGSIVNVSSIFGAVGGFGGSIAYHASKGAVRLMSKNAAIHWAKDAIRVNSVHPGFIDTPMIDEVKDSPVEAAIWGQTPMGRLGTPGGDRLRHRVSRKLRGFLHDGFRGLRRRRLDRAVTAFRQPEAHVPGPGGAPADPAAIAIDPVCGMAVHRERAVMLEHEGRLQFFCSRGCRDEFLGVGPLREEARAEELVRRVLDTPHLLLSVFQPIMSLEAGAIVGFEALARFAPIPLQSTEAWFELAARAGLTAELEARALESALAVALKAPPPADTFLSLNVSPLLLEDPRIASVLAVSPVTPTRLVLELTERQPVADYDALREVIEPYRARGFRIAIDDAGAGYASMRHITELEPDFVKLDARIIRSLTGDRARQALVRAMTTFVREIGAELVAEGVEGVEDLELLLRGDRRMLVQGYAVGRAGQPWPAGHPDLLRRASG